MIRRTFYHLVSPVPHHHRLHHLLLQTPYVYIQPLDYYSELGYIHLGLINVAHVGITFNTDIEALKDRNEKLGIKDSLTFVDLKQI